VSKLVYTAIASLDGYVEDERGGFEWARPDEEVHAFANELERPVGTHLLGRRLYETMRVWETFGLDHPSPIVREFGELWRSAEKIVYSRTLETPSTARTRIERRLEPESIRRLKAQATRDLSVGGAELAAQAIDAGLVDELGLFVVPVLVGGGKRALAQQMRSQLELLDERRFAGGFVYLRYRVAQA
jgi:dihydrofolate reductase